MSNLEKADEKRIDKRTIRAATESMTVVPRGKGMFDVYSGTRGVYNVNLVTGTCDCPDVEHNSPADGCKHLRRVEMDAGVREIPEQLGRCDARLMVGARERRPNASSAAPVALADGGTVVSTTKPPELEPENSHAAGCDDPECEGIDALVERPVLSFACWEQWGAYSEEQLIEEANQ